MLVDEWNAKGVRFKSTSQPLIATTTAHDKFIFQLFAILSQHERKRLILRTKAGLEAARVRGRTGGRKKGLSARYEKIAPMVQSAYGEGRTIREIMQAFSIPSSATVYKIVSASRQTTASAHLLLADETPNY